MPLLFYPITALGNAVLHCLVQPFDAIFIDWYGTLSTSLFWGQWSVPGHSRNATHMVIQRLWVSDKGLRPLLVPWMRGELASEHFVAVTARHLEMDYEELLDAFIVGCQQMQFVSDEVIDLVRAIRWTGTRVYIATDNMDSFTRWTVPALNLTGHDGIFDGVLNSYDLRCLKADRDEHGSSCFFGPFLTTNGIAAGRSLLIYDSSSLEEIVPGFGMAFWKIDHERNLITALRFLTESVKLRTDV